MKLIKFTYHDGNRESTVYWDDAGYGYNLRHGKEGQGERLEFRCRRYNHSARKCQASGSSRGDLRGFQLKGAHVCQWTSDDMKAFVGIERIKSMAWGLRAPAIREVFHREINSLPAAVRQVTSADMVVEALRKRVTRLQPPEPETILELHESLTDPIYRDIGNTEDLKDTYYQGVVGEGAEQSVVFASPRLLDWHARQARTDPDCVVIVDSTFWVTPRSPAGLSQLQRVGVQHKRRLITLANVFMKSRTGEAYTQVFGKLKQLGLKVPTLAVDLEDTQLEAAQHVWSGEIKKIILCILHQSKALQKYADTKCGLREATMGNPVIKLAIARLMMVPYLKAEDMVPAIKTVIVPHLIKHGEYNVAMHKLCSYMLERINKYGPDLISLFKKPYICTSPIEAAHRAGKKDVGVKHPPFWTVHRVNRQKELIDFDKVSRPLTSKERRLYQAMLKREEGRHSVQQELYEVGRLTFKKYLKVLVRPDQMGLDVLNFCWQNPEYDIPQPEAERREPHQCSSPLPPPLVGLRATPSGTVSITPLEQILRYAEKSLTTNIFVTARGRRRRDGSGAFRSATSTRKSFYIDSNTSGLFSPNIPLNRDSEEASFCAGLVLEWLTSLPGNASYIFEKPPIKVN
ncbi:hypothetical protein ONE63_001052 [Megalurothrips usitatus]|uniref:MULE transposase domain-containing protein n=1 Tax=Megalurothrips usitatus TaxID=439358 RepID=A0AAV7XI57_9NEOP|nr:hypothetical protein ONE63_001052 [Megalurothrips usitatus]